MADKAKAKLTNATAANVSRNIIGTETKDGKSVPKKNKDGSTVTKDGLDHGATVTVVQMRTATSMEDLAASLSEFFGTVDTVEKGEPVALVASTGTETLVTPRDEYVDGKRVVVRGKQLYPRSVADIANYINKAIQAEAAASLTAFNNKFKSSYGGGGGASTATALDDNTDMA